MSVAPVLPFRRSRERIAVDPDRWVEAAPFRAHLTHLCAASGLTWPVVALHAGLTLRHADALLHGREGRPAPAAPSASLRNDCGRSR